MLNDKFRKETHDGQEDKQIDSGRSADSPIYRLLERKWSKSKPSTKRVEAGDLRQERKSFADEELITMQDTATTQITDEYGLGRLANECKTTKEILSGILTSYCVAYCRSGFVDKWSFSNELVNHFSDRLSRDEMVEAFSLAVQLIDEAMSEGRVMKNDVSGGGDEEAEPPFYVVQAEPPDRSL